jgi:serine/threonine protein kinase
LLSRDGYIYAFGWNTSGELGNQNEENELSPHRIKTEIKFIDISSHWFYGLSGISIALSQNGNYYNWGKCGEEIIRAPKPTNFESFVEIYAKYFKITNKAIYLSSKYVIEFSEQNLISFGSFGIVSKVTHKNSGKIYAIKRIALNKVESEKAFKELNLMKKLKSHFVVEHIDSWIEKNTLKFEEYSKTNSGTDSSSSLGLELHPVFDVRKPILLHIQMEFCSQTLSEVMKYLSKLFLENDFKMRQCFCYFICCELLTEIMECVRYLHERKIIHRDLKPANILITDGINGRFVKLGDFGLSVTHEFNQSHTQCRGTVKYMAPEVIKSRKYDTKADVYSLGVIIEEMLHLM